MWLNLFANASQVNFFSFLARGALVTISAGPIEDSKQL